MSPQHRDAQLARAKADLHLRAVIAVHVPDITAQQDILTAARAYAETERELARLAIIETRHRNGGW